MLSAVGCAHVVVYKAFVNGETSDVVRSAYAVPCDSLADLSSLGRSICSVA